jgi:cytochrome o ubiquinol oxidase subunit 3
MTSTVSTEKSNTDKTVFGFWVYIMTDCVLFASLFATYAVLRFNTNGGPGAADLFSMPYVLVETLLLLTSSFTIGLALLAAYHGNRSHTLAWLGITFALGVAFVGMEISEFTKLYNEGHSWRASGFLSAFFTLVGTHGLHITSGLLWMGVVARRLIQTGLNAVSVRRLTLLSLFWHFLDIVWIFIFTIVYLLGAVS